MINKEIELMKTPEKAKEESIIPKQQEEEVSVDWQNTVFTKPVAEKLLSLIVYGYTIPRACTYMKMDSALVYNALRNYPSFSHLMDTAKREGRFRKAEGILDHHLKHKDKNIAQFVTRTLGKEHYSEASEKRITKITGVYHIKEGKKKDIIEVTPKKG